MQRLEAILRIHFALLAALGGLILGFSDESGSLPVIAVCSSLFAYVFVDWLKLFSLPTVPGYLAMGLIAAYCISDFIPLSPASNRQLLAVAQLLVLVQAVLMLQAKTRRTFEQIGIFSLLEIVVAAVFNNALTFALLLVPIAILGISAMVLLQAYSVAQPLLAEPLAGGDTPSPPGRGWVQTGSPSTSQRLVSVALRLPRPAIVSLGPAVLLVGLVFFYAIPRTAESDGLGLGGTPQVGFSDSVTLNQIGQLQQNKTIVMRVALRDASTEAAYRLSNPLYLRGRTLEHYDFAQRSGHWQAGATRRAMDRHQLPREFFPSRTTDNLFFDRVNVEISQQPQSTRTAFSIPPYYRIDSSANVHHSIERWLLTRSDTELDVARSRVTYKFGTHAFRNGVQMPLLRSFGPGEEAYAPSPRVSRWDPSKWEWDWRNAERQFDPRYLPELVRTAEGVVQSMPQASPQPYSIAHRLNQYVAEEAGLRYTLDLSFSQNPRLDPVEEFLTIHRAGHCQYFASTLALMLRSQGIPSRLIVGYKTDEYSPYGEHYVVRQSHAHVWVEAFLRADQLPPEQIIYGQPSHGPMWLRLDPTPGSGASQQGQVTQAIDYAQGMWEKYLLDMDGGQQQALLAETGVGSPLSPLFDNAAERLKALASGRPGGGALAAGNWFSFPAAALGIGTTVLLLLVLRIRLPQWWWWGRRGRPSIATSCPQPQLDFFAELCTLLQRTGMQRHASQTPREFVQHAHRTLGGADLPQGAAALQWLTNLYYGIRFGNQPVSDAHSAGVQQALEQVRTRVDQFTQASAAAESREPVVVEPSA